jgi:hypothetical protein
MSEFSELMQGIESAAIAIAVIGGGIWALFTFNALRLRQKARAEIEQIELQLQQQAVIDIHIEATQLVLPEDNAHYVEIVVTLKNSGNRNTHLLSDRLLFRTELDYLDDLINGAISEDFRRVFEENRILLSSNTFVSDEGSRWWIEDPDAGDEYLIVRDNEALIIYSHAPQLCVTEILWEADEQTTGGMYRFNDPLDYVLRVDNQVQFPYVIRVKNPGLYFIAFNVEVSKVELEVFEKARESEGETQVFWSGEKYFVVNPL